MLKAEYNITFEWWWFMIFLIVAGGLDGVARCGTVREAVSSCWGVIEAVIVLALGIWGWLVARGRAA